jgi:ATP-dependent helicase/nuclease subunit A
VSGRAAGLPDQGARSRATRGFGRNLVVTAGAGTGKTSLLVERALNLVAAEGIPIEGIAAITFTEKAAAELRRRISLGLASLHERASAQGAARGEDGTEAARSLAWLTSEAGVPPAEVARRSVAALDALDAASIGTIHAFCSDLLRRHPREAGVDPAFAVDEGPGFTRIFDRVWERFLAEELAASSPRADAWRRALIVPGALDAVRELGRALASFSLPAGAAAPGAVYVPAPPILLFGARAEEVRSTALDLVVHAPAGMNPNMKEYLAASAELLTAFLKGGVPAIPTAPATIPYEAYLRKAIPAPGRRLDPEEARRAEEAARRAQALLRALGAVDEAAVAPLVEAALPLAARAREELLAAGLVSFDALLRLARDLLAEHPRIRRETASRFPAILVDEFQDTDPLQYEILFFIAEEGDPPAADAYRARLAPGRLFIVGDPKQSIYRFRGADVEAYGRAVERILACGGERVVLAASFRAPEEIVAPVNALFRGWIGPRGEADAAYEPVYEPIASARGAAGGGPRVEIWSVGGAASAASGRSAEGEAAVRWIADNHGKEAATGRPLAFKDVAILLRALTNAGLYAEALRRAGIPFAVEGGRGFYERAEVGDLIAFLRAAVNPDDGASVLAVLRSPLGAVTDVELARYAAAGGRLDAPPPAGIDRAAFAGVLGALDRLARFRRSLAGLPPDEAVRAVLDETPLALLHASLFDGAQRVANLRKIASRAEELAREGLSLEEAVRFIEDEYRSERVEGESPLADETVDAVRILSIHKAKGLEYPVVLLPDVGREAGRGEGRATEAAWLRAGAGGFLAVRLESGIVNLAWARRVEEDRRHEEAEEKRVLYVGCTRARERLILLNSNFRRRAPWREALGRIGYESAGGPPPDGLLAGGAILHRRVAPEEAARLEAGRALDPIWEEAAAAFEAVAGEMARAAPPVRWPAGARDEAVSGDESPEEREGAPPRRRAGPAREIARLAGTAVHAALEAWDFRDAARLREMALGEAATEAVASEIESILDAFLATGLPARLAAAEASGRILGREVPILYRDGDGTTWLGSCDLVYRDEEGAVVAADYKTHHPGGEGSAAAERYSGQVGVYVEALRRALPGERVRGELLLLRTGAVVAIRP